ncbi:chemotaxis protein CheW [Candidatus Methylospira mobilis]|uniref:chemotaxis protein CheW n=1 Tax=Candidatus Methylospira mobilis TaxID=1808979 RepID=UPI0028E2D9B1|nr:chemotaxis protein CheW [Candidatus Methylospira mobilis]WNV03497.1 chemotaxis protein CheW [Candidatus Methylospira mobilis]
MSEELDEVWGLFAAEGNSSLDEVEERLLHLRDHRGDAESIAALFRAMHTFKGNARVMGLANIEAVAHAAEDLIGLVRDEGVALDEELNDLILETADHLRKLHEQSATSRRDVDAEQNEHLLERLHSRFQQPQTDIDASQAESPSEPPFEPPMEFPAPSPEYEPMVFEPIPEETDENGKQALTFNLPGLEPAQTNEEPESIIFDSESSDSGLFSDPVYREVFTGLAQDALANLETLSEQNFDLPETIQSFAEEVESLRHAAQQIGLTAWEQLLQDYLDLPDPGPDARGELLAHLKGLFQRVLSDEPQSTPNGNSADKGSERPSEPDPVRFFFDSMREPLEILARRGQHVLGGIATTAEEFNRVVGEIRQLAEAAGYVGVADVMERRMIDGDEQDTSESAVNAHFNEMEYRLYEQLAAIAETELHDREGLQLDPQSILRLWCADHAYESLLDIREHLEYLNNQEDVESHCEGIKSCLRRVYHACHHYHLDTAAHLIMSIVDLVARVESGEMNADAVLLFIIKSFLHDMELILNAVEQGEYADLTQLDRLQEVATELPFISSGAGSSSQIESRLSLPRAFHKVLTPESVHDALTDLSAGYRFYILRADLNSDEALSERLIAWVSTGKAHLVSNVTVFVEDYTLFDFLLSTPLQENEIRETISRIDPSGKLLTLESVLIDRKPHARHIDSLAADSGEQEFASERESTIAADQSVNLENTENAQALRLIGELVTGQSQLQHLLARLQESDLGRDIDQIITQASGNWTGARDSIHVLLAEHQMALEHLAQIHIQNSTLLTQLQEETLTQRVRSAALLLQPLHAYVGTLAGHSHRNVELEINGEEENLDFSLFDRLKPLIRHLLDFIVWHSIELPEQRKAANKPERARIKLTLSTHEGHVNLQLEDDGKGIDLNEIAERTQNSKPTLNLVLGENYGRVGDNDNYEGHDLGATRLELRRQGGDLRIAGSQLGGLRFNLTFPLATVVLDGMVIRVGEVQYIVPIQAIQRIVRAGSKELTQVSANEGDYLLCMENEKVLPIQFLRRNGHGQNEEGKVQLAALLHNREKTSEDELKYLFVVVGGYGQSTALAVDELIGQQQVLIRPLEGYLSSIRGATGCALLGSGDVGIVLDMSLLLEQATAGIAEA